MKFLAAICVLAVGVSAQVGPSGIVSPDGVNTQFSHDFANDIVLVGPSGIVTKSGSNRQLTHGEAELHVATAPLPVAQLVSQRGVVGHSGIVRPDGNNLQFSQALADNIAVVGPSGIVTKDGRNIQFTDDLHFARKKRSVGFVSAQGNIGTAGILRKDGSTDLFSHDLAHDILLIGPSGIVTKSGRNIQLTDDLRIALGGRTKRSLPLVGPSGMITADGTPIQFKEAGATILLDGPSSYVLSDGTLVQKRAKRSTGFVSSQGNIGTAGILRKDGSTDLFSHDLAHDILLIGPSGIVTKSGRNVQLTDDLRMAINSARTKRHVIGESGIITSTGQLIQLEPGVTVVHAGPSGIVLSNGKNIQL